MAAASSSEWLARLTRLNPATGRGECRDKAPHKPLLLLCLLDMAESGELPARVHAHGGVGLEILLLRRAGRGSLA